jgi:hypothetical protein
MRNKNLTSSTKRSMIFPSLYVLAHSKINDFESRVLRLVFEQEIIRFSKCKVRK